MEIIKNPEFTHPDEEKDCPRCTQPLGTNMDCENCVRASGKSQAEVATRLKEKRALDKKFIPRNKS